jgi:hypothetical protein
MPITIPKPILLLPKVPSLLVVGLLAAQFFVLEFGSSPEPSCTLNVEKPHQSTSLKETQNFDAIKLNITSKCTTHQSFTRVTARIQTIENNREVTVSKFASRLANSTPQSPDTAIFRNLFAECRLGIEVAYKGVAEGYVILDGGKRINVAGDSGKYEVANCSIGAQ